MAKRDRQTPLAEIARPQNFDGLLGQEEIWGNARPLRKLVEKDSFNSLIFWGPPGSGKTTLALLIGKYSGRELIGLSAVHSGVKDIRAQIGRSEILLNHGEKSLLMFMDEIHRLNKAQQDVLLPALETGTIKFIGATTENPSFEVNNAILSRCLVWRFTKISDESLVAILKKVITEVLGGGLLERIDDTVLKAIAHAGDGDARRALTLLDALIESVPDSGRVTIEALAPFAGQIARNYDKSGDYHYDIISAFIKSIRASQPDAAIYYLARMLEAGEDPMFIARRLVIAASEDIGNANPTALVVTTSAMQAVHMVGMPEARIILAQATTYLAASPKSNRSYLAIDHAIKDVAETGALEIPFHLRNAPTRLMKEFGYGEGYVYAHDDQKAAIKMSNLPKELTGRSYYQPSDIGVEKQLKENLAILKRPNGSS